MVFSRHSDIPLLALGGGRVLSFSHALTSLLESARLQDLHIQTVGLVRGENFPLNKFFNTRTYRSAVLLREKSEGANTPQLPAQLTAASMCAPPLSSLWRPSPTATVQQATSHVLMVSAFSFHVSLLGVRVFACA